MTESGWRCDAAVEEGCVEEEKGRDEEEDKIRRWRKRKIKRR